MSRFDYVRYDQYAACIQEDAKTAAKGLEAVIDTLQPGRAQNLAYTALEECYMWIGKAIRDNLITRNGPAELNEERGNS